LTAKNVEHGGAYLRNKRGGGDRTLASLSLLLFFIGRLLLPVYTPRRNFYVWEMKRRRRRQIPDKHTHTLRYTLFFNETSDYIKTGGYFRTCWGGKTSGSRSEGVGGNNLKRSTKNRPSSSKNKKKKSRSFFFTWNSTKMGKRISTRKKIQIFWRGRKKKLVTQQFQFFFFFFFTGIDSCC
jgi:hypothetical protein